jgi:hypothetical protein
MDFRQTKWLYITKHSTLHHKYDPYVFLDHYVLREKKSVPAIFEFNLLFIYIFIQQPRGQLYNKHEPKIEIKCLHILTSKEKKTKRILSRQK